MASGSFESGTYFLPRLVRLQQELNNIKKWVGKNDEGTDSAVAARQRWARLAVDSHVLKLKSQRALTAAISGAPPGPEGSSTKVQWSESHQTMLEFALEQIGRAHV